MAKLAAIPLTGVVTQLEPHMDSIQVSPSLLLPAESARLMEKLPMWKKMVLAKPVYTIPHTTQAWLCGLHQYAPSNGTEFEALKTATPNAAQIVELAGKMNPYQAHKLGVIMPDAWDDAVFLDGNPMNDITRVRPEHVKLVRKGGTVNKNALQEAGRLIRLIQLWVASAFWLASRRAP